MNKRYLLYPATIGVFLLLIFFIIDRGQLLPAKHTVIENAMNNAAPIKQATEHTYIDNFKHPLSLLLLQIVIIMVAARLFGKLAKMIKQPSVVGEIIAGVLLGPSLLGYIAPSFSQFLFAADSMKNLQFLSQIGLAFFMFIVGMELDLAKVRNKAHDAILISHASIVVPFSLGVGLAYFIFDLFAPANVTFIAFALFMGIAMSITAFPVLARIIQERKLSGTPLGVLAITCAAADDITAWCILAVVVAIAKSSGPTNVIITIALAIAFVAVMLLLVRPLLKQAIERQLTQGKEKTAVAMVFLTLLISAWITEVIGIHALFGAFLAGVIMPVQDTVRKLFTDKLEDVSVMVLLPIFFAFTGLRTEIGLLSQGNLWAVFGIIMLVAVGGKFGGSALAAKLSGQTWQQSLSIGALMNTRGLMELIVLNIGYDLGIFSAEIFSMMVLMALTTTFMTAPILDIVNKYDLKFRKAVST